MAKRATTRLVGILPAILLFAAATSALAPSAFAQDTNQVTISQVQLGDIFAQQTITVVQAQNGATAATTAVANSAVGVGSGSAMNYQATQELNAEVSGKTNVSVADTSGPILYATTSATGNTGTAGTCCAVTTGNVTQTIDAYHGVTAESYAYTGGGADTVSVDSAAIGNSQGWEAVNGAVNTTTTQIHYGTTVADTSVNVADADEATYTATAVANNMTTDATNSSTNQTVSQDTDGYFTQANVAVAQGSGGDVTAASTAIANNINVTSDSNASSLASDQLSTKPVTATASVNLDSWSGTAAVSAYGVSNSAIVSNSGPSTTVNAQQTAQGLVTVTATLTGGTGGDAFASAAGVGNTISGYACSACNGVVKTATTQSNSGGVQTNATINAGVVNSATGISTAIGNSATFVVQKPSS